MIGIGDAYPCSASAKNTTVFTRSVTTAAAAADVSDVAVLTPGGKGHGGDGVNLPLSRLSRYSAACNKAAILIFDGGRRLAVLTHTAVTQKHDRTHAHTLAVINRSTQVKTKRKRENIIDLLKYCKNLLF